MDERPRLDLLYVPWPDGCGDWLADCLYRAAALWLPGHKLRKGYSNGDPDWESGFYILKNTLCSAALSKHPIKYDCQFN